MAFLFIATGIVLVFMSGFMLYFGWPKNGQIQPVAANNLIGEIYTFAIILSFALGMAFFLYAVLSG